MPILSHELVLDSPIAVEADQRLRQAIDSCFVRELIRHPDEVITEAYRAARLVAGTRQKDPYEFADISSGVGCIQIEQPKPHLSLFSVKDYHYSPEYRDLREHVLGAVNDDTAASLVMFTNGLLIARHLRRYRLQIATKDSGTSRPS